MEKNAISVRYVTRYGVDKPKYTLDIEGLEIGDWFVAKNRSQAKFANRSLARKPATDFNREPHGVGGAKYTRIA